MKKQSIIKLIMAVICLMTYLNVYAETIDDAKKWLINKSIYNTDILYNAYQDRAVWYTIYKNEDGLGNPQYSYGCLAPNAFRLVDFPVLGIGKSYKILIEVKDRLDCSGVNICKTDSTHFLGSWPGHEPEFELLIANKNGSNCFISYHGHPNKNLASEDILLRANYQRASFGTIDPSPLIRNVTTPINEITPTKSIVDTNSNFRITAAFYGREGQPTWEINGQKIVDIITRNTTNGVIWIPPNMNQYFGGDPLPNQPKIVAVQIVVGNQVFNLRQVEGRALQYPGVEGTDYWIAK